jgi:catechol 2,3-dioxygenase-like lactoylglutathione lyase family enzyme
MLHHASLGVPDIERSAAFYDAALGALGYVGVWDDIDPDSHALEAVFNSAKS